MEGGGNGNSSLQSECRRAFTKLLEAAGLAGRLPSVHACGGRSAAFEQFCTEMKGQQPGDIAVLLVDAESPVTHGSPWDHVRHREEDGWKTPNGATDDHLHLMVQCMEAWFLADRVAMSKYFANGFRERALPPLTAFVERVSKDEVYSKLTEATKDSTRRGKYSKGRDSFALLATLDPARMRVASPWAERFFSTLDRLL